MKEINRITIPLKPGYPCKSLVWAGDELIDWVSGSIRYAMDGTVSSPSVFYAYKFDHAVAAPNGEYIAIIERLGTKGLILKNGKIVREINRSYYYADDYEYPIIFLPLPDGRMGIAHCPKEYCKLEIEEVESGKSLTRRSTPAGDFFHSHLSASIDGHYLSSAGWFWHPFEHVNIYDIWQALKEPDLLNSTGSGFSLTRENVKVNMAVMSEEFLILSTEGEDYNPNNVNTEEESLLAPDTIAVYNAVKKEFKSKAALQEMPGVIFPVGTDHVLGCYKHPKLIDLTTGRVVARWEEFNSGVQTSCIIQDKSDFGPPLAVDTINKRFALAGDKQITVIQLGE